MPLENMYAKVSADTATTTTTTFTPSTDFYNKALNFIVLLERKNLNFIEATNNGSTAIRATPPKKWYEI